jgi:NAD-dependent dihydropyrimidine dehydrogenase PreA subunit
MDRQNRAAQAALFVSAFFVSAVCYDTPMVSRRQFLRGDFSGRKADPQTGDGLQRAVISNRCVAFANVVCRSCGDACGEAAIRFSPRLGGAALPEVIAARCTGCGDCVPVCPAGAIAMAAAGGKS